MIASTDKVTFDHWLRNMEWLVRLRRYMGDSDMDTAAILADNGADETMILFLLSPPLPSRQRKRRNNQ